MTSYHHGNASLSSHYSDEEYRTKEVLESEHGREINERANLTRSCVMSEWTGYVPDGLNGSITRTIDDRLPPSPKLEEHMSNSERGVQNIVSCMLPPKHESKTFLKLATKTERVKSRLSRPPLLPPCRVCGDRASGFHYGVNTCEACKGFFRRSINKTSEPYTCVGNGRCKMVPGKRTACSACRYQRCLEVGMSKSAIKTGRYTHELRSKNIMEVKKLQLKNSTEGGTQYVCDALSVTMETEEAPESPSPVEDTYLESMLQTVMEGQKHLYEFLDDYYNEDLIHSRQLAVYERYMAIKNIPSTNQHTQPPSAHTGKLSTADSNCSKTESVKLKVLQHPIQLDIMVKHELCPDSISTDNKNNARNGSLVYENGQCCSDGSKDTNNYKVSGTTNAAVNDNCSMPRPPNASVPPQMTTRCNNISCIDEDGMNLTDEMSDAVDKTDQKKKAEVLAVVLQDMERGVQGMLSFSRCLPDYGRLPKEDQAALLKAARFDIWFLGHIRCFNTELQVGACEWQFHAEELSKVWGTEVIDPLFRLSRVGQSLNLTKEEVAVLRAVSLTFPDRCYPLTERDQVEAIHNTMLELFHYVSSKRHKNFNIWFAKIINFLTLLREFGISFEKASSCLKLDWSVLNENPYLLEVFLS